MYRVQRLARIKLFTQICREEETRYLAFHMVFGTLEYNDPWGTKRPKTKSPRQTLERKDVRVTTTTTNVINFMYSALKLSERKHHHYKNRNVFIFVTALSLYAPCHRDHDVTSEYYSASETTSSTSTKSHLRPPTSRCPYCRSNKWTNI